MQGTRIPDGEFHREPRRPGDYGLTADGAALWVVLPSGVQGRLHKDAETGWLWDEEPDGTLTVHPSIHDAPNGWHGWLRKGQWEGG